MYQDKIGVYIPDRNVWRVEPVGQSSIILLFAQGNCGSKCKLHLGMFSCQCKPIVYGILYFASNLSSEYNLGYISHKTITYYILLNLFIR